MGWNRYYTQFILYLTLLNRWTESFHNQCTKENILNMPVFQITILICFRSVNLYLTKMRLLNEVYFLPLFKSREIPKHSDSTARESKLYLSGKSTFKHTHRKQTWSERALPKLSLLHQFFHNSTLWGTKLLLPGTFTSGAPQLTFSQQTLAVQLYYDFSTPILPNSLFLKTPGKCFQK